MKDPEADDEGLVRYTFRPSSPLCPFAVTLALRIKRAVAGVPGHVKAEGLSQLLEET